jgi:hypothetical protein
MENCIFMRISMQGTPATCRHFLFHHYASKLVAFRKESHIKTQARCLCYCKTGRDARKHRQDACATARPGATPGATGKMPVLLQDRARRPEPQARCLCYCKAGRDARSHRQDACATARFSDSLSIRPGIFRSPGQAVHSW